MDKIEELLTRGVEKIYPSKEELEKVLRSGKKLRLYQGFDPTGTQLHIGHMVGLRKLRQWQDLGHYVIFVIGDGTGQAGDPSGKTDARKKFFTREQLRKNALDYIKQAGKIVRFKGDNPVEVLFNGDWLNKLTLVELLNIANHFTLSQLSERDLYRQRAKKRQEVNIREFLYPLLQAYDSVAMKVDLELGGTDQTFNMLMGRHLVKAMQKRDKFVMTTPLLTDAHGVKIGKTEGNVIGLTDKPPDLFAKIMALSDDVIVKGMEYLTDVEMDQVRQIAESLKAGKNPIIYKKKLAFEIVKQLNGHDEAHKAQEAFEKDVPVNLFTPKNFNNTIMDIVQGWVGISRSEAKRLVEQGGVSVNGEKIKPGGADKKVEPGMVIKSGRKIIKINLKES